jgi:hypothetical protein
MKYYLDVERPYLELLLEEVLDSYQNQPWQVENLMEKLSN